MSGVVGCPRDRAGITTSMPQIAADSLERASRRSRAMCGRLRVGNCGLVRRSEQPLYLIAKPTTILAVAVSMHPRRAVAALVSSGDTALGTTLSAPAPLRVGADC